MENRKVTKPKYEVREEYQLDIIKVSPDWLQLFTDKIRLKKDEVMLPGFSIRTFDKYTIHYKSDNLMIISRGRSRSWGIEELLIIDPDGVKKIHLSDILPYKVLSIDFNPENNKDIALLLSPVSDRAITILNLKTGKAKTLKFYMNPFSQAIGDNFLVIGLRDGYDPYDPAEMYKISSDGKFIWGLSFSGSVTVSIFGTFKITPYLINVISQDIFVTSFWFGFNYNPDGELVSTIDISELENFEKKPQTILINNQVTFHMPEFFGSGTSLVDRKPLFHPGSNRLIYLEVNGRISAWSLDGKLYWYLDLKKKGYQIRGVAMFAIINELILVIDSNGQGYWLEPDGHIRSVKKYPFRPKKIGYLPSSSKWVFMPYSANIHGYAILNGEDYIDTNGVARKLIADDNCAVINDVDIDNAFCLSENAVFQDAKGYLWTNK